MPIDRAHEFLKQIVVFVGAPGGTKAADRIRSVFSFDLREFFRHQIQGFVPTGFLEFAVFFDKRFCKTLVAGDKLITKTALHAKAALVDAGIISSGNAHHLIVQNIQVDLAPAAAIRAGGRHFFNQKRSSLDAADIFRKGAGRAMLQTFAAGHAGFRIDGKLMKTVRIGLHVQRADAFDFLTGRNAPQARDAALRPVFD